ncbi:MAG: endonuclease [Actinomycetota bacterium]
MIEVERSEDLPATTVAKADAERTKVIDAMLAWREALADAEASGDELPDQPKHAFSQYKSRDVKETLAALFAGKCAYCESFYSSTQPMDVEHYRPKGAVASEGATDTSTDGHHGYYWLGADWDNLLPSCIDCNRKRTQEEVVVGHDTTKPKSLGKKDRFPVAGVRSMDENGDIELEEPLLLNPCLDDPDDFIRYDTEVGVVLPKEGLDPSAKLRAETSIEIYGLNRIGLVQDRRHVIRLIDHRLAMIAQVNRLRSGLQTQPELLAILDDIIRDEIDLLRSMEQPNQPYSGLVRQLLAGLDRVAEQALGG